MPDLANHSAIRELVAELKNALRKEIINAPFDKTSKGVIVSGSIGKKYEVQTNVGTIFADGGDAVFDLGDLVRVVYPQNNLANAYIISEKETPAAGGEVGTTTYSQRDGNETCVVDLTNNHAFLFGETMMADGYYTTDITAIPAGKVRLLMTYAMTGINTTYSKVILPLGKTYIGVGVTISSNTFIPTDNSAYQLTTDSSGEVIFVIKH